MTEALKKKNPKSLYPKKHKYLNPKNQSKTLNLKS